MNNLNILKSCSKALGANSTDFTKVKTEIYIKDSVSTSLNPADIVLKTSDLTKNSVISKQNLGPYKYTYLNDSLRTIFDDKHASDNAVKQIETSNMDINHRGQIITYTSFNSVETLRDTVVISCTPTNDVLAVIKKQFYYGSNGQRVLMVSYRNDTLTAKKYYVGEYEYTDSVEANRKKEVTYISAPTGIVAAKVRIDNVRSFYYVLTDQLGSITQLLDSNGYVLSGARFTYDAWGRLRDISNTTDAYNIDNIKTKFAILDRGYCGHEHLLEHGIINMNGRIYDPVVGQFMQPDNYVQTPEDYIGYNRYSYCRHNPFKFTDPSGEMFRYWSEYNTVGDMYYPIIDHSWYIEYELECGFLRKFSESKFSTSGGGGGGGGKGATPAEDKDTKADGDTKTSNSKDIVYNRDGTPIINKELKEGDKVEVYDKDGNYLGRIVVSKYEATDYGVKIRIDFVLFGTNDYEDIRAGQTVRTNSPKGENCGGTYNDPYPPDDDLPYYYTNEQQEKRNIQGNGFISSYFADGPGRTDYGHCPSCTMETWWTGEMSFFGVTSSSDIPLITFSYGYQYFNGYPVLYPLMIISPTQTHLSYYRR